MKWLDLFLTFFISLLLLALGAPWWCVVPITLALGYFSKRSLTQTLLISLASPSAWVLLALFQDARMSYRISPRIAGVLELPSAALIYFMVFLIATLVTSTAAALGYVSRKIDISSQR